MRNGYHIALAVMLLGAGLALAQSPPAAPDEFLPTLPAEESAEPARPEGDATRRALPTAEPNATSPAAPPPSAAPQRLIPISQEPPPAEAVPLLPAPTPLPNGTPQAPAVGGVYAPVLVFPDGTIPGDFVSPRRFWTNVDFLIMQTKDGTLPIPLVTSTLTPITPIGAIGSTGTVPFFNVTDVNYANYPGAHLTMGYWIDPNETLGVEWDGFFLLSHGIDFLATSVIGLTTNVPGVLARPFTDVSTGSASSLVVALPGTSTGAVGVSSDSLLWGMEANLVRSLSRDENFRFELLAGLRYLDLEEDLNVIQNTTYLSAGSGFFNGAALPAGSSIQVSDRFYTRNQFAGGQLGARLEMIYESFLLSFVGKVALGSTHEALTVAGNTQQGSATLPGGLLALPSNIGRTNSNEFTVIPQFGIAVGYQASRNLNFIAGYQILYWSRVVRPGSQVSPFIDSRQVPSSQSFNPLAATAQPAPLFQTTSFWAQGISLGMEVRY